MQPVIVVIAVILAVAALAGVGWVGRRVFDNPRGDFDSGVMLGLGWLYARVVHLVRVRGRRNVEAAARAGGPLIVVANHTAGVDPVLIQAVAPFYIRWMMAEDMRAPLLEWFWQWWGVIFVDRQHPGGASVRQAIRHLREGGVIGIFPEGGIERPPRHVMPFQQGIGVLIHRTGARVLPVTVDGTPQYDPAWASLWRPSASRVHFHEVIDYAQSGLAPEAIASDLRERFLALTGWPANDSPPPWEDESKAPAYGAAVEVVRPARG